MRASVTSEIPETRQSESGFPDSRYAWYVVFILFLAYVVSFLDRQILSLLVDPIKADLGLTDTMVSLLHGFTFALFYTLFGLPLGRMADRRKRTHLIIGGVALWSIMTAACGFARNMLMLFFARVGVAVGEAALSPSAYSLISDYFPRAKRGRAISLYSLGIFAGAGMAYIFGGVVTELAGHSVVSGWPLLNQFKPWQLTFIITGTPGILIILLMLSIREPQRRERVSGAEGGLSFAATFAYIREHFRVYFALLVGNSFIALANYALFAWLPAYFIRVFGYSPGEIGKTFGAVILVFGTIGLVTGGILADARFRQGALGAHFNITVGVAALAIAPSLLLLLGQGEGIQLMLVALIVFCGAVTTGLVPAAMQLITPNEFRGQIAAIYLLLTALVGLGLGPTAVALLVDFHFRDTMAVGSALAMVLSATLLVAVLLMLSGRNAYLQRQRQFSRGVL